MAERLRPGLVTLVILAGACTQAGAAVEREDIIVLNADGHHYTSYKTLRSDLSQRVLYLGPDEPVDDTLFIVPSDYTADSLANGGTRLKFDSGSFSIMSTGRFEKNDVSRADNGDLIFTSWDGETREDGHLGKWNAPGSFDSFAYSWVVPDNIEIQNYRANRAGRWTQRGNTLSWRGEQVNDIAFTIRYRKDEPAQTETRPQSPPTAATIRESATNPPERRVPSDLTPKNMDPAALQTTPSEPLVTPAGDEPTSQGPAPQDTTRQDSVLLDDMVTLIDGKPRVTINGRAVLDRLAQRLADNDVTAITITGPTITQARDTGGSAAKAARVADYLSEQGLESDVIMSEPGGQGSQAKPTQIRVRAEPAQILAGFGPDT